MTIYHYGYHEGVYCSPGGSFEADSDEEAKEKAPEDCVILYRKSNTSFTIILGESK